MQIHSLNCSDSDVIDQLVEALEGGYSKSFWWSKIRVGLCGYVLWDKNKSSAPLFQVGVAVSGYSQRKCWCRQWHPCMNAISKIGCHYITSKTRETQLKDKNRKKPYCHNISFQLWNWWVQYRSPADTIQRHADLLKLELCCYSCAVLTFVHGMVRILVVETLSK